MPHNKERKTKWKSSTPPVCPPKYPLRTFVIAHNHTIIINTVRDCYFMFVICASKSRELQAKYQGTCCKAHTNSTRGITVIITVINTECGYTSTFRVNLLDIVMKTHNFHMLKDNLRVIHEFCACTAQLIGIEQASWLRIDSYPGYRVICKLQTQLHYMFIVISFMCIIEGRYPPSIWQYNIIAFRRSFAPYS